MSRFCRNPKGTVTAFWHRMRPFLFVQRRNIWWNATMCTHIEWCTFFWQIQVAVEAQRSCHGCGLFTSCLGGMKIDQKPCEKMWPWDSITSWRLRLCESLLTRRLRALNDLYYIFVIFDFAACAYAKSSFCISTDGCCLCVCLFVSRSWVFISWFELCQHMCSQRAQTGTISMRLAHFFDLKIYLFAKAPQPLPSPLSDTVPVGCACGVCRSHLRQDNFWSRPHLCDVFS